MRNTLNVNISKIYRSKRNNDEDLNEILAIIKEHPQTKSSRVLAAALASACNAGYAVSLLDVQALTSLSSLY